MGAASNSLFLVSPLSLPEGWTLVDGDLCVFYLSMDLFDKSLCWREDVEGEESSLEHMRN